MFKIIVQMDLVNDVTIYIFTEGERHKHNHPTSHNTEHYRECSLKYIKSLLGKNGISPKVI